MNLLKTPLHRTLRLFSKRGSSRGFAVVRHLYLVMGLSMIGLAAVTIFFYVKTLLASGASVDLTFRAVPIVVALVVFSVGYRFCPLGPVALSVRGLGTGAGARKLAGLGF
jgi:hypothetical protein